MYTMAADTNTSSLGYVWLVRNVKETPVAADQQWRLSMVNIKTQQAGEYSKSCEIIEPKNETINTPTRRITHSIYISSQSKDFASGPSATRVVNTNS